VQLVDSVGFTQGNKQNKDFFNLDNKPSRLALWQHTWKAFFILEKVEQHSTNI